MKTFESLRATIPKRTENERKRIVVESPPLPVAETSDDRLEDILVLVRRMPSPPCPERN
jgi:hypothetical protein